MTKRSAVLGAVVVAFAMSVAVAHAATKHAVNDSMKLRVLTGGPSLIIYTGTISDKAQGQGAVVVRVTPGSKAGVFNTQATAFFKKGTVTVKGSNTSTTDANGDTQYAGSVKAVGGTGVLKGVTGTVKLTGSSVKEDPTYGIYKLTGSLTY